jgi:hypothetical protein
MSSNLDHISVALPDQKNYEVAYGLAFKLAAEQLGSHAQIEELCRRSDSLFISENEQKAIRLSYLNSPYQVNLPDVSIDKIGDISTVELRDKILILHYLLTASGRPLSGELISFKELGEGLAYYPTFAQRVVQPLITHFGSNPVVMLESTQMLGGIESGLGDFAVTISAFKKVPITLVVWRGDDEFPPNANVLFDRYALEYLPLEDLIVLCQTVVWKMVKYYQSTQGVRI